MLTKRGRVLKHLRCGQICPGRAQARPRDGAQTLQGAQGSFDQNIALKKSIWSKDAHRRTIKECRFLPSCFQGMSQQDRKSTRLNSSHVKISYAVFCLKKKITSKHMPHSFARQPIDSV